MDEFNILPTSHTAVAVEVRTLPTVAPLALNGSASVAERLPLMFPPVLL